MASSKMLQMPQLEVSEENYTQEFYDDLAASLGKTAARLDVSFCEATGMIRIIIIPAYLNPNERLRLAHSSALASLKQCGRDVRSFHATLGDFDPLWSGFRYSNEGSVAVAEELMDETDIMQLFNPDTDAQLEIVQGTFNAAANTTQPNLFDDNQVMVSDEDAISTNFRTEEMLMNLIPIVDAVKDEPADSINVNCRTKIPAAPTPTAASVNVEMESPSSYLATINIADIFKTASGSQGQGQTVVKTERDVETKPVACFSSETQSFDFPQEVGLPIILPPKIIIPLIGESKKEIQKGCDVFHPTQAELKKYATIDQDVIFDPSKILKKSLGNAIKLIYPQNQNNTKEIDEGLVPEKKKRAERERKYRLNTRIRHNQLIFRIAHLEVENGSLLGQVNLIRNNRSLVLALE